jgi:AraC family transcriptional regulator
MDSLRGGFVWYYMYAEGMQVPEGFEIVDFPGGLYAVATDIDGQENSTAIGAIKAFLTKKGCFVEDTTRQELGNIITPPSAAKAMGYSQMDYYTPVRIVE